MPVTLLPGPFLDFPLNPLVGRLESSAIRDMLAVAGRPGMLSLAGGLPAGDLFPVDRLARVVAGLLATDPGLALQYGPTEGHEPLRAWIAAYESLRCGREVALDQVLVTAGSQQALDLVARTLCSPGDTIVVEEPGYLGALQVLRAAGIRLVPVPVDADGLDVENLAVRLAAGLRPVAVHTVTSFQNPSGTTLREPRRRMLAALADRYGFVVVEDDPYAELCFDGRPRPPVRSFGDRVVTLGSFSKTVAPGLRVGWAVLPQPLVTPVVRLKQAADLHTSALGQAAISGLVADRRWWRGHLDTVRAGYSRRATALADALGDVFGARLTLNSPSGGMFLWGRFTDGTSTAELLPRALDRGVIFVPGVEFHTGPGGEGTLRLAYATNTPDGLAEAARRLRDAHAGLRG
ncbi:MAG: 2-aminoadipate transaminase [Actinomycetota bacterium]|nr:2-aminoadipate transaminase [Actinomycetota bacterium]